MSLITSTMRLPLPRLRFATVLVLLGPTAALAEEATATPLGQALIDDAVLQGLLKEALDKRPELTQARATIAADLERVPQAGALPDPVLTLGIQNDGFKTIQIGKMEGSFLLVMASQTFPWYGKRGLRADVLTLEARRAQADLERTRLSVRAEVERGYLDLLLVRDQVKLQSRLETLWTQAEGSARARYESGEGAQSDILRAQLERSRLKQRRWALTAEERRRVAILNRLRGRPLDDTVPTDRSLADLADPVLPDTAKASDEAETQSPELAKARLSIEETGALVDLAKKDYFPDLTVSAGLMPRWGQFEWMWQAGLSFSLPVWAGSKQSRAVAEGELRGTAAEAGSETVRRLLRQRVTERVTLLAAILEANELYRSGLLVQSEATVSSTLAQYQVGRVTFASVLEALTGYVADLNGFYESVAAAHRLEIAQREVSLDAVAGAGSGEMGGGGVPGAGGMGGGAAPAAGAPSTQSGETTGSGSMSRM